jgi:hypothetical protein
VWAHLVPDVVKGAEESRRRNDPEKASNVHNAFGASGVLCAEHATGKNELHW